MADPFIGEIRPFGFNFAPYGWAFCDGQLLPIQQNTALFAVIGINFGGNGTTNFNLPNLQGRAAMHMGTGPGGLTPRTIGQQVGNESVALTQNQIPVHTHPLTAVNVGADKDAPGGDMLANSQKQGTRGYVAMNSYSTTVPAVGMASTAIGSVGSGLAHDNMQPYTSVNLCIALQGLFPVRG